MRLEIPIIILPLVKLKVRLFLNGAKPTYLILDGQQRLTSLYQAFYGVGEYLYFLDLNVLDEEGDFEEAIYHVKANAKRGWQAKELKKYSEFKGQCEDWVFPLWVLFGDKDGYQGWAKKVCRSVSGEKRDEFEDSLDQIRSDWIKYIEAYKFPVVLLSDETKTDAVCTIFETLNRTGVKLSVFDLLAARFWPENVKLREMWEKAISEFQIIEDFQIDPYYVLQAIALLSSEKAPSCKRKDVLSLTSQHVKETWSNAIKGLADTLNILQEDCGVFIPKWLPYNTILIPFTAILARFNDGQGLAVGEVRQKLVRWFWCSVFGQAYENSPNSMAAKDFIEVANWLSGGEIPGDIKSFTFVPESLYEVTPKQRALYRGTISLILSNGPRDFYEAKPITKALTGENPVDDHHIFPNGYLKDHGVEETKRRDLVLNRTLIDKKTNIRLSKRDPSEYFSEIKNSLGEPGFVKLLNSHLIPSGNDSAIFKNDYESFLEYRCQKLSELVKKATS
ncbi:conserved hypothetical protein [Nitrospina gracilis 3/211]|uniref:GmrSD restriction endonucleases N-terminal domain-containing protein n=1 Tax=Nitrospina gracilis (strain 3/211) TaxID=1266370 RepID=M1Z0L0_NITG3|nr:conserved hypothetical protein [Nitrospina gracilis 3/211]